MKGLCFHTLTVVMITGLANSHFTPYLFSDDDESDDERVLAALARIEEVSSSSSPAEEDSTTLRLVALPTVVTNTTKQQQSAVTLISPWVKQFLASCHRDVLLPVPTDYLLDNFNLAQLGPIVERIANSTSVYREALQLIVQSDAVPATVPEHMERAAKALYLMVHQRYILSPRGLDMVRRRFLLRQTVDPIFGQCPSLDCHGMPLLPIGDSENYNGGKAKRYCCNCQQVWYHWDSKVDGCAWGPSFCHLFLLTCGEQVFGQYRKRQSPIIRRPPTIFGFQLHPSALL
jgi:casein kinase II subunit beta